MINPYLRFVREMHFIPRKEYLSAIDYHFYFILSDFCAMKIESVDYKLRRGTIIILPPGTKYLFDTNDILNIVSINFDYTQNYSYIIQPVQPSNAETFDYSAIIENIHFENYPFMNAPIVMENMNYLSDSINAILREHTNKTKLYGEFSSSFFKNILLEVIRHTTWEGKSIDTINSVLDYIHNHYSEEINNTILSHITGYHSYHLNRLMKCSTGTTLRQYLINYRIEAAMHYLRETNQQIFKISELCGYKNFSNFSADFKKKTGLSPSAYRRETQHLL